MADEKVKNNLKSVDDVCSIDEQIKYLRDLAKGEIKDNLALFADGAFERAVQIAISEKQRENELTEQSRNAIINSELEPEQDNEGLGLGD